MKINKVEIDTSPDMQQKLCDCRQLDSNIGEAWGLIHYYSYDKGCIEVTAALAEKWCTSWFTETALRMVVQHDDWLYLSYPAHCADPLIKEFVNAVLGIYRLCQTV